MLKSNGSWGGNMLKKFFSKYFKDKICKIKQYLNHILMMINQNILAILRTFWNLQKSYEKLYTVETTSRAATTDILSRIPNRYKKSNEQFNLSETKISLYEIIKSINSKANNKSPGSYILTAESYVHFWNELAPFLLDVYDSSGKAWHHRCYF